MGNNMVGVIHDAFEKKYPELTIMKIWNKNKLYLVLAVEDVNNWKKEFDPYYYYNNGEIRGVSVIDNMDTLDTVMTDSNLIYIKTRE